MSVLTKGRSELSCYNNIGGIKNVYLFKYVDTAYNLIVTSGLELTSFPSTYIYKYEIKGGSFTENIQNDEQGVLYQQNCSFTLLQQDLLTTNELDNITKIDLRYIVEFNDGTFKIGGLYNGAKITSLDLTSGGSKQSFNGYNITITSSELYGAAFIDDLEDVGFIIDSVEYSYQFQDDNNFVFQDLNNFIFNG
jgi:hypothetical protein